MPLTLSETININYKQSYNTKLPFIKALTNNPKE